MCIAGRNEKGQLGLGHLNRADVPTLIECLAGCNVIMATCGRNHTLFLTGNVHTSHTGLLSQVTESFFSHYGEILLQEQEKWEQTIVFKCQITRKVARGRTCLFLHFSKCSKKNALNSK